MSLYKVYEELYEVCRIPFTIIDKDAKALFRMPAIKQDYVPPKATLRLLLDFTLQKRDALHPLVTYVDPGYFVSVAAMPGDTYCIIGPVSPFKHTRSEITQFTSLVFVPQQAQELSDILAQMPQVNLYQLKAFLCLLVHLTYQKEIAAEDILFVDNTMLSAETPDDALFALRENAEFHVPIDFETGVWGAVEAGNVELLQHSLMQQPQGEIGRMSLNPLQQQKYAFVSFVTLATRAAIRGGLPEETAFSLSDVYCQRADAQTGIRAIQKLTVTMALDFCRRVADIKNSGAQSTAVKACINYISEHLHDDLRLEELSRHCGLCGHRLSEKFKAEMGMGIPEYIHREKLREGRYLLDCTDYTLAEIAGFLNYPTQSYFTQIFKKYQGCTPQQYRSRLHKTL